MAQKAVFKNPSIAKAKKTPFSSLSSLPAESRWLKKRFISSLIRMNLFGKITTFLKEVRLEMKKVNWPDRRQTIRYTLIVIGVSLAVAAFLGTLDFIFNTLLTKFVL